VSCLAVFLGLKLKQFSVLNYRTISILIIIILSVFLSCSNPVDPPGPVKDNITVSVEDITHRSVNMNVKNTAYYPDRFIRVMRHNGTSVTELAQYPAAVTDTTLTDDNNGSGLSFNTTYSWYAQIIDSTGAVKDSSSKVTVSTLDTTTHNYTWQEFTITGGLYGVWGTDENNVYACGTIIMNDSPYSVIRWNGTEWLPYKSIGGAEAVFGFSNSDIWLVGNFILHFNGVAWKEIFLADTLLRNNIPFTSVWGTSSNNMYFGANNGKIIHWNGEKANLTEVRSSEGAIADIWGFSEDNIYAAASAPNRFGELWHYNGISWKIIRTGGYDLSISDTYGPFTSVWGKSPDEIFLLADQVEVRRRNTWHKGYNPDVAMTNLRGTNSNNVFICGHYGKLAHYNGVNWKIYNEIKSVSLRGLYVTENKVFVVGTGIIYIGHKQ
jgi:hypothetical protein